MRCLVLLLAFALPAVADDWVDRLHPLGRALEPKPRPLPERLARLRAGEPRFHFVMVADVHLGRSDARLRAALRSIKAHRPEFVLWLGDNVNRATVREQRRFAALIGRVGCPHHVIKGDNDSAHYTEVFGSTHWSFRHHGIQFVGTGIDIDVKGAGVGRIAEASWRWLDGELARTRQQPTLLFCHEPAVPPSFADAPRLVSRVMRSPQVRAVFHGHLHLDLDFRIAGTAWLTLPALGPHPRHAYKRVFAYDEGLLITDWEQSSEGWRFSGRWQWLAWGERRPRWGAHEAKRFGPATPCVYPAELKATVDTFEARMKRATDLMAKGKRLAEARRAK